MGSILLHCDTKALFLTESLDDLLVSSETQSSQECCKRELTCTVYTNVHDTVLVFLELEPCTSVRNDLGCVEDSISILLTSLAAEVSSRRSYDLGDNNSLGTVNNECTVIRHDREITDISILFLALACLCVTETKLDLQRSSVVAVFLVTIIQLTYGMCGIELFTKEIDLPNTLRIRYGRYFLEDLLDSLVEEPVVRILLDLDKIGDFDYFIDTGIGLALGLALFDGMNHYQITS